jgi:hypothetical protein
MALQPSTWDEFIEIGSDKINSGTPISDAGGSEEEQLINQFMNNQEILREYQIDGQFGLSATASASYVTVVSKPIWIAPWLSQPVSNLLSTFIFHIPMQYKIVGGTSTDIRLRIGGGTWIEKLALTGSDFGGEQLFDAYEHSGHWDPDALAGSDALLEIQTRANGGGTVTIKNLGCSAFIRRSTLGL